MGRGVPPGNKTPVSAKRCKPRKKAEGPALHGNQGLGESRGWCCFRLHVKTWGLLSFLLLLSSPLKLPQATWVSPSITVATVTLTTNIEDSLGHRNPLSWSQAPYQGLQDQPESPRPQWPCHSGTPSCLFPWQHRDPVCLHPWLL